MHSKRLTLGPVMIGKVSVTFYMPMFTGSAGHFLILIYFMATPTQLAPANSPCSTQMTLYAPILVPGWEL